MQRWGSREEAAAFAGGGGGGGGIYWTQEKAKRRGVTRLFDCAVRSFRPLFQDWLAKDEALEFYHQDTLDLLDLLLDKSSKKKGLQFRVHLGNMTRFLMGESSDQAGTVRRIFSLTEEADSEGWCYGSFKSASEVEAVADAIGVAREALVSARPRG